MERFLKIDRKRLLFFATLLLILVAIPLTLYLSRQQQDTRSRAAISGTGAEFTARNGAALAVGAGGVSESSVRDVKLKVQLTGGTGAMGPQCQLLYNKIQSSFGTSCGENNYDKVADIDKNRDVNINDFSQLSSNAQNETYCTQRLNDQANPCTTTSTPTPSPTPVFVSSCALLSYQTNPAQPGSQLTAPAPLVSGTILNENIVIRTTATLANNSSNQNQSFSLELWGIPSSNSGIPPFKFGNTVSSAGANPTFSYVDKLGREAGAYFNYTGTASLECRIVNAANQVITRTTTTVNVAN